MNLGPHRVSFFFFLMIRRPPRSTPFPTRRSSDLLVQVGALQDLAALAVDDLALPVQHVRSEEHTSELQSRRDLVCRLLLEKKKKKICGYLHLKKKKKNT